MARVHTWQFLVNEVGEPIGSANVSIYLAGSLTPANIYLDEFSGDVISTSPQLTTLSNGYFEFWIADIDNTFGYASTQKFKLSWEKTGIASGVIDYIDIFPSTRFSEPVDEGDWDSTTKDKLVSNRLAFNWQDHIGHDVTILDEGLPIHGIDLVDYTQNDHTFNKLINNNLGYKWEQHRESTVQNPSVSGSDGSGGTPHGLYEVDITSKTTTVNKLVSDKILYDLIAQDTSIINYSDEQDLLLSYDISAINTVLDNTFSVVYPITGVDWTENLDGTYYKEIAHNFGTLYPTITVWDTDDKKVVQLSDIESISALVTKITANSQLNLMVRMTN